MQDYDVAIVGYGPAGATLAHLLAECGVRTLVLEREGAHYHLPRAVHFDAEVMRTFQWIGIADRMEPKTARHPGMRFVDRDGRLLLDWPRPQGEGPQGWRANYRFHQPDLETVLRDHMTSRDQVTVRTRCDVFHVEENDDHVELRFEDMSCGRIERARAKYVVGCDGARSLVRRYIESGMEDYGFHERWLVVDVILNRDKPELGDHSIQYCVPERPATYVRTPGLRRRWEITVLPDEDSHEIVRPDRVWELLSDWLGPDEAELERAAVYVFHSLVAEDWRKGRLLLAGDACHQTPPFMGQGMCAGIRDVTNLYWKLALVCKGLVGGETADALLDTYESERKPNAREYIQTAVRLGGLINTSGTEEALRAALPSVDGSARMKSIMPPIGPGLGAGDQAGQLFGQPRMADGTRMDALYPHQWVVVTEAALADGLDLPAGVGLVTTANSNAAEHLSRLGVRAAVLRPDRYTLGGVDTPEALEALVARILPDMTETQQPELV
ncbi:bifunctional 3-(3-hydroxy-phenyl)propionate/3-hydroxycinnamic acid hydroxylase [Lutimaribacter sp. EGI FJ00015]|uniref:Bifunctional 3-(3-hydroxy-phenyl)propionate/3-hydroxycinnamic acid hydroxylase n=1 Tax=Lutimaribacter degradans TaxID=2945989 RepID=A0ACC5ZTR1_9RHOB|nr:bifunctional 3-(3-hydroxy-phenyl)propionate/3-hydroxycinnamic acid hydroxylase [Lutimaribacter sp. EGI FJ00013]MCM2561677.1 bifunctional 3-(3-hydroxy-phenyl)propionate/3-hydroxycinnamic acid hydroxylase [Lutimaribacter sp. EGI FJ00013]MCO0612610.1 bifunctional 3-(3-hydroxy-phenyl)propionate/3-hydroxycinnamic acid hydroxylase [Lutimaribacter sp. EGI FJ00015]MCO0635269.1 bifunctional 3-(3-hydroxy-phenyl)propionate/3-hydroxycinnamic acid hydroxylase [Lutimaribacter sp. EGI FJ00014]